MIVQHPSHRAVDVVEARIQCPPAERLAAAARLSR
jgi:hypothetical protein